MAKRVRVAVTVQIKLSDNNHVSHPLRRPCNVDNTSNDHNIGRSTNTTDGPDSAWSIQIVRRSMPQLA